MKNKLHFKKKRERQETLGARVKFKKFKYRMTTDRERGKQGTVTKRETRDVLLCLRSRFIPRCIVADIHNESFHRRNVIMVKWGK